jgi:hypothetical protein
MSFTPSQGHMFDLAGANVLFAAKGIHEATEGVKSVSDANDSFWNQDYQGFSHLGAGVTGVFSGVSNLGVNAMLEIGARSVRSSGNRTVISDAAYTQKGKPGFWVKGENESLIHSGNGKTLWGKQEVEAALADMRKENLYSYEKSIATKASRESFKEFTTGDLIAGTSKFEAGSAASTFSRRGIGRFLGSGKGMIGLLGLQMAATYAVGKATSFAGSLMDEAHLAYQQGKSPTYDLRQFNNKATQNWGMNAMGSLQSYEMNNLSISRAYHHR